MSTTELIMTPFLISGGDAHAPLDSAKIIFKRHGKLLHSVSGAFRTSDYNIYCCNQNFLTFKYTFKIRKVLTTMVLLFPFCLAEGPSVWDSA